MPLPEIVTPTYTLTVPSSKKKIKYRPFLVKEQKTLIKLYPHCKSEDRGYGFV